MDSDLELFKDYFESFNTEDSYQDPIQEDDPLGDLNLSSDPNLFPPFTSQELENSLETLVKQEAGHDSTREDQSQSSSSGLRIANFAVDPDLCSILDTQTQQETQPDSYIRFPVAKLQLRKIYTMANNNIQIVNSGPQDNSFGVDFKLLLPTSENTTAITDTYLSVKNLPVSECLLSSEQFWIFSNGNWSKERQVTLLNEETAVGFFNRTQPITQPYLVSTNVLKKIATFLQKKNIVYHFKECSSIRFYTSLNSLDVSKFGYEGTPQQTQDVRRLDNVRRLKMGIFQLYEKKIGTFDQQKLHSIASLMEEEMFVQLNHDVESVSRSILVSLKNFIHRVQTKPEYTHLMVHPDIFYLALTKPHLKIRTQPVSSAAPIQQRSHLPVPPPRPGYTHPSINTIFPATTVFRPNLQNVPVIRVQKQLQPNSQLRMALEAGTKGPAWIPSVTSASQPVILSVASLAPQSSTVGPPQSSSTTSYQAPSIASSTSFSHSSSIASTAPASHSSYLASTAQSSHSSSLTSSTPFSHSSSIASSIPFSHISSLASNTQSAKPSSSIASTQPSSSASTFPPSVDLFVCPFYPHKCKNALLKTREEMINHWTLGHFFNTIDKLVYSLQIKLRKERQIDLLSCPHPNCGFYADSKKRLIMHYGYSHNVSVKQLQRESVNLQSLVRKGFQFLTSDGDSKTSCPLCGVFLSVKHLNHHLAIKHFSDMYLEMISATHGYPMRQIHYHLITKGVCPGCDSWRASGEQMDGFTDSDDPVKSNKILLLKHYSDNHYSVQNLLQNLRPDVISKLHKDAESSVTKVSSTVTSFASKLDQQERKLFCKVCKRLVASKFENASKVRTFSTGRTKCDCKLGKGTVTCRFCGSSVECNSNDIERHLDSNEHKHKEKVFNLLTEVYYKSRNIDEHSGYDETNYKFFILALKSYAVHNDCLTVMDCLSVMMNVLKMSLAQYKELYRHVDRLAGEPVPNFLCYSCNYAEYGQITSLSRHTQSDSHTAAQASLSREYLFCTHCNTFFYSENIMDHADHLTNKPRKARSKEPPKKRKRLSSNKTQEEEDEDHILDDILKSSDEEDGAGADSKCEADSNKEKTESLEHPGESVPEERDMLEDYYYFCLDCEEELFGQEDNCSPRPRCPISMDLSQHVESRGHTNFEPISGKCDVKIRNLSFSAKHHKNVIKKWKKLIKDGDISEVRYDTPRACGECNAIICDAIDMFKHIKDKHMN